LLNVEDTTAMANERVELGSLMQRVADQSLELIAGADGVMIGLADRHGVSYVWGAGADTGHVGTRVNMDASLSGLAIRSRQVLWADDTETDPRVDVEVCRRNSARSFICMPLFRPKETLGALVVTASRAHAFDDDDVRAVTRLAEFASAAIAISRDRSRPNPSP
jgi:GAF domain-containing protein